MKVYLEANDIPDKCYHCPFVNSEDACILQDDDANFNADTWDDLKQGCPLIELPEQPNAPLTLDELRKMDGEPVWLSDGRCFIVNKDLGCEKHGLATSLILEAVELPDGDILLGFRDPYEQEYSYSAGYIDYYKLSEIALAYSPRDAEEDDA